MNSPTAKQPFDFTNNPQNIELRKQSKVLYIGLLVHRSKISACDFRKLVTLEFQTKLNIGEITSASLFKLHQYLRHCGKSSYRL